MEPGSALDQGTKDSGKLCTSQKKNEKNQFLKKKFLKSAIFKASLLTIYFIDFFIFLWFISSVMDAIYLHSFTYYIKNYPGKIFLLKRKFVLLLLLCRIVITKKTANSSETALLVYRTHVRPEG